MSVKFKRFMRVTGALCVLPIASLRAADVDAETEYADLRSAYVKLRGGWLFGKGEFTEHPEGVGSKNYKTGLKHPWAGSAELGALFWDYNMSVGLEFGYSGGGFGFSYVPLANHFAVAGGVHPDFPRGGTIDIEKISADGSGDAWFVACNVTPHHDLSDRMFLYGGVGAGLAYVFASAYAKTSCVLSPTGGVPFKKEVTSSRVADKCRGFFQCFAGLGWDLNDDWSLTLGYRLTHVSGANTDTSEVLPDGRKYSCNTKSAVNHAAEIGLTYRF